jgi:hypothetical protein
MIESPIEISALRPENAVAEIWFRMVWEVIRIDAAGFGDQSSFAPTLRLKPRCYCELEAGQPAPLKHLGSARVHDASGRFPRDFSLSGDSHAEFDQALSGC